jgi:outer membrane protein OmpA-like peptidoglycan-associated protein
MAHELAHTIQQRDAGVSSSSGAATTISRAPLPGAAEPEPISLFSSKIPEPVITRFGTTIVATVYFGQGNFLLDSRNYEAVDKLADELRYLLNPSVGVDGYASTEGKEENNQRLSENRRTTVIAILRSKLIGTATFSGKAHGAADPAVAETGKKGAALEGQRALNRRVTIVIVPSVAAKPAEEEKKKPIKLFPDPIIDAKPETDQERLDRMLKEAIKEAEEKKRRGEEKKPEGKSFNDLLWKKFDKAVDDATKKLNVPEKLRPYIKDAARAAVQKGTEAAIDAALDQFQLSENDKEAIKAAIEAAAKMKPPPQ